MKKNICNMIAIEIGGTNTRIAHVYIKNDFEIKNILKIPTNSYREAVKIINNLVKNYNSFKKQLNLDLVDCIAISCTGVIDKKNGIIKETVNLPLKDFKMREELSKRIDVPIFIENDSKAGAFGEYFFGAGKQQNWETMAYIVIGTGIGGAIIHKGKIMYGKDNFAGEFGHISISSKGQICRCGRRGCVDAYASGHAIKKYIVKNCNKSATYLTKIENKDFKMRYIINNAMRGDDLSKRALSRAGIAVGMLVSNIIHSFNPNAIILNGGVLNSKEFLLKNMYSEIKKRTFSDALKNTIIKPSVLLESAGLLGISKLAYENIYIYKK